MKVKMIEARSSEFLEHELNWWFERNDVEVFSIKHAYAFEQINSTNKQHYYTAFIYYYELPPEANISDLPEYRR